MKVVLVKKCCIRKQLSDEVFVISRIIKVKVARLSAEAKARG